MLSFDTRKEGTSGAPAPGFSRRQPKGTPATSPPQPARQQQPQPQQPQPQQQTDLRTRVRGWLDQQNFGLPIVADPPSVTTERAAVFTASSRPRWIG